MVKHPIAILLFVLELMLLATSACKKEKILHIDATAVQVIDSIPDTLPHLPPYRPPWPMVKTMTVTYSSSSVYNYHYYYDSLWRLIKRDYGSGSADTFSYTPGEVKLNGYYYIGLDANGLTRYETYGSGTTITYGFNTDSNVVSRSGAHFGTNYDYLGGNMVHENGSTENGGNGFGLHEDSNSYNFHPNTIGYYNTGQYYFGKSSVNLLDHTNWHRYISSSGTSGNYGVTFYSYTYNDSGWVSHIDMNDGVIIPNQIDSVTILYDTTYTHYQYDYTYY